MTAFLKYLLKIDFFKKTSWIDSRYTNAYLKICHYLRFYMEIICWRFHIKTPFTFWNMHLWDCEKFVYKYSETIAYVKN